MCTEPLLRAKSRPLEKHQSPMATLPFCDLVGAAVREWGTLMEASPELLKVLSEGVRDMPMKRVVALPETGAIPQDTRSIEFGEEDLTKGLLPENSFYRRMTAADMVRVRSKGRLISSAFTVWQEKGGVEEGRFEICLNRQSKFYLKGPTRMEGAAEFCTYIKEGDRMISFDVKSGYRHLKLHPDMINDFVFCYNGQYYQ